MGLPVHKPLAPQAGDNQAVAVNTTDNTVQYDVAFVLVTGDNHVAVKQNNSAAVNYDCVNCLSYAFATQLFVTLDGPLSDAGTQQIAALWQQIADFGTHITEVPLSEIRDRLTAYEQQILQSSRRSRAAHARRPGSRPVTGREELAGPDGDHVRRVRPVGR
ncbi:MAG: hypothetical protein ABIQ59_13025 [Nocardioidaceae bacterium]